MVGSRRVAGGVGVILTRVESYREAAGLPLSGPAPISCLGVCGGVPGWRDLETGFPCSMCGGSGSLSYPKHDNGEGWEHAKEVRRAQAERAEVKRAGKQRQPLRVIQVGRTSGKAEMAVKFAADAAAMAMAKQKGAAGRKPTPEVKA